MGRAFAEFCPWFRPKAEAFERRCREERQPVLVTRTGTTDAVQAALYAVSRRLLTPEEAALLRAEGLYPSDLSRSRTRAQRAHDTAHGLAIGALAFDCVPLDEGGRPWWDAPPTVWRLLYRVAEECGLDALGDPWGEELTSDKGHMQEPGWRLYRDFTPAAPAAA